MNYSGKMHFLHAKARQPETIRTVQKDLIYTNELTEDLSDILRMTGPRNWIKYNNICKLFAEISYHGFACMADLQTLGEEYTGIIQINSNHTSVPSKLIQLSAIILEFGGEALYLRIIQKLEKDINNSEEVLPEAKEKLKSLLHYMKSFTFYIKALHKTIFYIYSNKYQISKRVAGINYTLIRHWMQPNHSLYGYKILGLITLFQLAITLSINLFDTIRENRKRKVRITRESQSLKTTCVVGFGTESPQCILCLEPRIYTTLTSCGHLFCWRCILEWLDERDDCPLCREIVKKSNVIQLRNFM